MIRKLGDIADIQFGLYAKPSFKGNTKYLHAGHFDKYYNLTKFEDSFVDLDSKNEKFLLQANDVILAGKGHRLFAWAYDPEFGNVIPSSLFYIIRTNSEEVLSSYLAQHLNSEKTQYRLRLIGAGATIPSVPKRELQQIKLNIPPIDEQLKVAELLGLLEEQIELSELLLEKRSALKKAVFNSIVNYENKMPT